MADITLVNKTGTKSHKGYLVVENPLSNRGFKYIGVNAQSTLGSVAEEVDNNQSCKITTSGEGFLFSVKSVKKGDTLRSVKQGDGLPLGTVVVAKNADAPYLRVGIALESGRGIIPCMINVEYIYTTLNAAGQTTIVWNNITNVPPAVVGALSGNGTQNYVAKYSAATTMASSQIFDDGTGVGINTATLGGYKLNVNGSIYGAGLTIPATGRINLGDSIIGNEAINDTTEYGIFGNGDNAIASYGYVLNKYFYGAAKLVVDHTNSRVGINNVSPSYSLDVTGEGRFTGNLYPAANVGTATFISGFAGSGWQLTTTGGLHTLTVDNLTVRGALTAYELDINKINSVNGGIIVSVANGTCTTVSGNNIYFDEDGTAKQIQFAVNDIVRAQQYTGSGIGSYIGQVTSVTHSATYGSAYITCTTLSGTAWNGMELVQAGNTTDTARQNLIYVTAADTNNPYIDVLSGVSTGSFSGKTRVRLGNLTGITDPLYGALSGYGLWSENVYLSGSIKATGGQIAGWTIDTDAIYTGTKKTTAGYTTSGITIASNGSIRSKYFEIDTSGYAKFESVDSIFKSTYVGVGDLAGTVAHTQANFTGQPEIDTITLTGTNGYAMISCNGESGEAQYVTSLVNTAAQFVIDYYDAFLAVGVTISNSGNTIRFTSGNAALSPGAAIQNTSGDLSGTKADTQAFILSVARIDTVTLTGTGGEANIRCKGETNKAIYNFFGLSYTATDFVTLYAADYLSIGVIVTSNNNDIIFTAQTAGVDFSTDTIIANSPNIYLGSLKIQGNEVWENDSTSDGNAWILINRRGYMGGYTKPKNMWLGDGMGGYYFKGYRTASSTPYVQIAATHLQLQSLPTSSAGLGTGELYRDGAFVKIVI